MTKTPRKTLQNAPGRKKKPKTTTDKGKSLKQLKKALWSLVSKFVRLKDATPDGMNVCYTCGSPSHWKSLQAGHGISGRGNSILFEIAVIRPQCYVCNMHKHGNYEVFIPKLVHEIGLKAYEDYVNLSKKPRKLTKEWYEAEIAYYQSWLDEFLLRDAGL